MIKEALAHLEENAKRLVEPVLVSSEPAGVYFLRQPDGKLVRHEASPQPRNYTFHDLGDLVAACKDLFSPGVILVDDGRVTAIADEGGRGQERCFMPLDRTDAFYALSQLEDHGSFTQGNLVHWLRVKMSSWVDPAVIELLRSLNFAHSENGKSEIRQGKSTLGRQVEQSLIGAGENPLPETLVLNVPVFARITDRALVRCALMVDLDNRLFRLGPYADELRMAVDQILMCVRDNLCEQLAGTTWKVFCGTDMTKRIV